MAMIINRTIVQFHLCKLAFKKFYFRPFYIWCRIKNLESFHQLIGHAKTAFKMVIIR